MQDKYHVRYDDGETVIDKTYTPDDLQDIEFFERYVNCIFADGDELRLPWETVIFIRKIVPKDE